ncbi:unnamed protein product, partial [Allacma fusca]
MKERSKIPL